MIIFGSEEPVLTRLAPQSQTCGTSRSAPSATWASPPRSKLTSRAGLDAQRAVLTAETEDRGWDLELVQDAGYSAEDLDRPALTDAPARLDAHKADVLVVSKLDRLLRSVHDFSGLLERSKRRGWSLVCLDLGVDTTERTGRFVANLMANVAELERGLISDRTRDALAAKKAQGVRLGRPQVLPLEVVRRVVAERDAGRSWQAIADGLTADAVPTARGGATPERSPQPEPSTTSRPLPHSERSCRAAPTFSADARLGGSSQG